MLHTMLQAGPYIGTAITLIGYGIGFYAMVAANHRHIEAELHRAGEHADKWAAVHLASLYSVL